MPRKASPKKSAPIRFSPKTERRFFTKIHETVPLLDLIESQRTSYRWFLAEGLRELCDEVSPIRDFIGRDLELFFEDYYLDEPKFDEKTARAKNVTFEAAIRVRVKLVNKRTGEIKEQEVYLGDFPLMTPRGTFIVNGIERVIVSQLIRSAGVFFTSELIRGRRFYGAKVIPNRGAWLEIETDGNNVLWVKIDRKRKVAITSLLRAFGYGTDEAIYGLFPNLTDAEKEILEATLKKDAAKNEDEGLKEVYKRIRPGDLATASNAKSLIHAMFFNFDRYDFGKVGRYKINQRFNLDLPITKENRILRSADLALIIREIMRLSQTQEEADDIDHLGNRRVRTVGELVQNKLRVGLARMERIIKDRMSTLDIATLTPNQLINARPVIGAIKEFFMSSQLSQFMDQTNPLAELEHKRRLSAMGPGGLSRERAGFDVRDVHRTHYGRICPIATPEGPNIGLVGHLACYARINEFGFLETPYLKVVMDETKGAPRVTSEVVYLTAFAEERSVTTAATTPLDDNGYFVADKAEARVYGEPRFVPVKEVQYMDVSPKQIVSVATSLIPFLEHDDAVRALMGTNMQRQAISCVRPEAPIVGTGVEYRAAMDSGQVILAEADGEITGVQANKITIQGPGGLVEYHLGNFVRSNASTSMNQKPIVNVGDTVKVGTVIADGAATDRGELALGQNVLVGFMSWEGGNYEDAILISERLVHDDRYTSIHIDDYSIDVRDTKLGPEIVTRDIPNVGEEKLKDLDTEGIIRIGAEVASGDILVGKITPKGETELSAEEKLLRAIFGEKAKDVRDSSLYLEHGEHGKVVDIKIFSRENGDKLPSGVLKTIQASVASLRKVQVGDKMAGRHGNKGVISKIVPIEDMPFDGDGRPLDIILNPLGVASRMNLGQILETHLGLAAHTLGYTVASPVLDGVPEATIREELMRAGYPADGKIYLYDGRTGARFDQPVTVGFAYIMKLNHLVEDKIHQRSIGPYSLVTQQPLGGKAQFGGQRFGEMEVWALEAYGAAHTLQEILTIKSDDVPGRSKAYEAIIKGEPIEKRNVPESFNVLVRELKGLGLDVELLKNNKVVLLGDNEEKMAKTFSAHQNVPTRSADFDAIRLRLASPENIHAWSHGQVTKPETINYRTQKPEKDGLFDERIFGPTKDWECYCGKYKRIRYKGIICDKCGVEVTRALVRRERMGHIDLAAPVSHIWFLRGVPSKMGLVLDLSVQDLEKVIYFANFIITKVDRAKVDDLLNQVKQELKGKLAILEKEYADALAAANKQLAGSSLAGEELAAHWNGDKAKLAALRDEKQAQLEKAFDQAKRELASLEPLCIISENTYHDLALKYGHAFAAGIGAEAVRELLQNINLAEEIKKLSAEMDKTRGSKRKKLMRRLKLLQSLEKTKIRPEWMVLTVVPVIPPDLRPMVQLDGGRFATSDLNDLYRRVINRNHRLQRLKELNAPEVIARNERRMLQEAVDALIDNGARHGKTVTASTGQRRVLKSIADMLKGKQGRFRQNLLGKRIDYSGRSVIVVGPKLKLRQCGLPKTMALELFKPFVISQLIARELVHNVRSANRYIEAGHAEVWDILEEVTKHSHVLLNRAPTLHRLGIQAFQPVLIEGKAIQVHPLVCTAFNADFDGDQMAVHVPLTTEARAEAAEIMLSAKNLLKPATGEPVVTPGKDIILGSYYLTQMDETAEPYGTVFSSPDEAYLALERGLIKLNQKIKTVQAGSILTTSAGRLRFNEIIPRQISFVNEVTTKKVLNRIVGECFHLYGVDETATMLDNMMALAFDYATRSGMSWGMDDLPPLPGKADLLERAQAEVDKIQEQYEDGLLTEDERAVRVIEVWAAAKDTITDLSKKTLGQNLFSPVYSMIESGARGSWGQTTQMMGMKGLVTSPSGATIELPVKASFKQGFDVLEYFISTHGARKGLTDTALRTANAGYLTRRLIDVSQDVIIAEEDCGDNQGWLLTEAESNLVGEKLTDRLWSRTVAEDVKDKAGEIIVKKGAMVSREQAEAMASAGVTAVRIRSAITCWARHGICRLCYGYDLGHNQPVAIGTAVGIIAAQSIGEPGTQLTMRTFHTGGVASVQDITQGLPRVEEIFESRRIHKGAVISEVRGQVAAVRAERDQKTIIIKVEEGKEEKYALTDYASKSIKVRDHERVKKGDVLISEGDDIVNATIDGIVKLTKKYLKVTAAAGDTAEYAVPPSFGVLVKDGDLVNQGDVLTEGSVDLHDLYALKGEEATQRYIIREIQNIYSSQGQKLNDKHLEIIARQMFSRVYVKEVGASDFLPGEVVERNRFEAVSADLRKQKKAEVQGDVLLLGVTKASLSTESFLSAASFQETARVLIDAAISGKVDHLAGLKENVIIGRLIPAGTGFRVRK